jgi:hypothetical protein
MPPLRAGEYLISLLFEAGPVKPAGMGGFIPIDQPDIAALQLNQCVELTPWECRALRQLSRIYGNQSQISTEPTCSAPYVASVEMTDRSRQGVANAFKQLAARRKKR